MNKCQISLYTDKNAYNTSNYMYAYGLPADYSFEEVLAIAIDHKATGICKGGPRSKWYLRNQPVEKLMDSLENPKHKIWPGMLFYVIH